VEDAVADGRVYEYRVAAGEDSSTAVSYDIFQVGVMDGVYLSEDFWVCERLRRLGFEITVDPSVGTVHYGTQRF